HVVGAEILRAVSVDQPAIAVVGAVYQADIDLIPQRLIDGGPPIGESWVFGFAGPAISPPASRLENVVGGVQFGIGDVKLRVGLDRLGVLARGGVIHIEPARILPLPAREYEDLAGLRCRADRL